MSRSPVTRPSLLVRLRDRSDAQAWREFVALYGPLVYRFARWSGLQDADAADLTQAVFLAVSGGIGRFDYDPARGTFRSWLFEVVRRQLAKWRERQGRQPRGTGDSEARQRLEQEPAPDGQSALWEEQYRRQRFAWAAERVRDRFAESTWLAFWRTAVEGQAAGEVAQGLGLTAGAVYIARSRVLAEIRREIQSLEPE